MIPFADYITLLEQIKGAMPDFEWSHDTTGAKDEAGFATVTFQVTVHSCCSSICVQTSMQVFV